MEILFASSDPAQSRRLHRRLTEGTLRQLAPRVYTDNLTATPETLIRRHLFTIVGHRLPGAILSHKTALKPVLDAQGVLYLTSSQTLRLTYPSVTVIVSSGPPAQDDDHLFVAGLRVASTARALLENCQRTRRGDFGRKTLTQEELEAWLENLVQLKGHQELNRLRHEAQRLAPLLNMQPEGVHLDALIAALLGTGEARNLKSTHGKARANGRPFDGDRIALFTHLAFVLKTQPQPQIADPIQTNTTAVQVRDFYDAYFSNFIEGTEFTVEEAEQIIFTEQTPAHRPQDAHDIRASFALLQTSTPLSTEPVAWLAMLRSWHRTLMEGRPEVTPGEFKNKMNRVGARNFVPPELTTGTLYEAYTLAETLHDPFARACFWKIVVSEVHPFLDGNGRISRLLLNRLLRQAGLCPIIIPTVFRQDYVIALATLTQVGRVEPIIQVLGKAQLFTAGIDFQNMLTARDHMEQSHAFSHPDESKFLWHPTLRMVRDLPSSAANQRHL